MFPLRVSTSRAIPTIVDEDFDRVVGFLSKLELMMILSWETFPPYQIHRNLLSIRSGRIENLTKFVFRGNCLPQPQTRSILRQIAAFNGLFSVEEMSSLPAFVVFNSIGSV